MPRCCLTCTIREPAFCVFDHCGRCHDKKQIYCSRICQKQDWKHHKAHCFTPAEATARKAIGKATTVRSCAVCKKSKATTGHALKSCAACRSVYYCGPVCQTQDWYDGGHGTACFGHPRRPKTVRLPLNAAQHVCQEQVVLALRCANAGDKAGELKAYTKLGYTHKHIGQFAKAIEYHTKALGISRELGFRHGECACLFNLASTYPNIGEFVKSFELYATCIAIARDIGDKRCEGAAYSGMGQVHSEIGDCEHAIPLFHQTLDIAIELANRRLLAAAYSGLCVAHIDLRRFSEAKVFSEQTLAIALEMGDRLTEMTAHNNLGSILINLGQSAEAIEHLHTALFIAGEIGNRKSECYAYTNLEIAHRKLGETDTALSYRLKSRSMTRELAHIVGCSR
jgi:tetratricopeptide (TPR) repeat protein